MTPDERQLLSGLFDRIRGASSQTRDREAETFISDSVRAQPYAPYLLAQTVIVQEQALRAANDRLQELESKVQTFERGQQQGGDTSFLGGLGRSIFGGGSPEPQGGRPPAVPQGGFGQGGYGQAAAPQQGQGGPWGQSFGAQGAGGAQGGGFLKGALGAAAGVAGGVLLANSISGLFHGGNNPFGIASGMPGMGGYPGVGGGETVVNNYYEGDQGGGGDDDYNNNNADYGSDDGGFNDGGSDDSFNV